MPRPHVCPYCRATKTVSKGVRETKTMATVAWGSAKPAVENSRRRVRRRSRDRWRGKAGHPRPRRPHTEALAPYRQGLCPGRQTLPRPVAAQGVLNASAIFSRCCEDGQDRGPMDNDRVQPLGVHDLEEAPEELVRGVPAQLPQAACGGSSAPGSRRCSVPRYPSAQPEPVALCPDVHRDSVPVRASACGNRLTAALQTNGSRAATLNTVHNATGSRSLRRS